MTGLFRNNNPLALLLMVAMASVPHFYYPITSPSLVEISSNETFAYIFKLLTFQLFEAQSIWGDIVCISVCVAEGLMLNKIISDNKIVERAGLIPGMLFILGNMLVPYEQQSYMLLINGLLLICLRNLISLYRSNKSFNKILLSGFLIGIISGFETFYFIFFVWLSASLLIMRTASLREWIILLIGFILPFYFLISFLYLTNDLDAATIFAVPSFKVTLPNLSILNLIKLSIITLLPLFGFSVANKHVGKILIQGRKTYILFLVLYLTVILICFISLNDTPFCFFLLTIPFAVMTSHIFSPLKRTFLPNLLLIVLLILSFLR